MSATDFGALAGSIPGILLTDKAQDDNDASNTPMDAPTREDYQANASGYDPAAALLRETENLHKTLSKKRKSPSPNSPTELNDTKRVRIDQDENGHSGNQTGARIVREKKLPAEIWQHIFTFLPPKCLGRLLSVNKLFHTCLNPSPSVIVPSISHSSSCILQILKPDAIWQASRRFFWPRMPAPMKNKSELDMWRLVCSPSCQFCSVRGQPQSPIAGDQWKRGPGAKGVSPVFPFFVTSCGSCLVKRCTKEIDILLSSAVPSVLLPALPVVFLTEAPAIIPPQLMQTGLAQPSITKFFWLDHLEEIKSEFESVKLLGSAAAEEWLKGLETRGKQRLADASRWEKWDLFSGVYQMQIATPWVLPLPDEPETSNQVGFPVPDEPIAPKPAPTDEKGDEAQLPAKNGLPGLPSGNIQLRTQGQQKRTKEEALELKAKRRAEIERRALLLDPPLTPDVLAHIPSFQAALQISTPLDESAWDLLKPRILSQRKDAESRVEQNIASARALQDRLGAAKAQATNSTEPKEVTDADWDEIQGPLRASISHYADEIIRDGWDDGEKVTKKNSAQFAAGVLVYVRKRFYAEVAKDAAAAVAAGKKPIVDPMEGPWTQKLTLENMKWVFDFKIKPHTDRTRSKELFLCNGCEGANKFFGFEAVIQHYAAKHTNALSVGSVVVHWRAEWPEEPPFHPDPRLPHAAQATQPTHAPATSYQHFNGSQPQHTYAGYTQNSTTAYPNSGYGGHMSYYGYGQPYATPGSYTPGSYAAHGSVPYDYSAHYYPYTSTPYPATSYFGHFQSAYAEHPYAANQDAGYGVYNGTYTADSRQDSTSSKVQFETMMNVARETWSKVGEIREQDLPASVKVCVIIHHIAKKFQEDLSEAAHLGTFLSTLHMKEMRAIRNVKNTLSCKACSTASDGRAQKTDYSLPQLAKHFLNVHSESVVSGGDEPLDWRIDMVSLPAISFLETLKWRLPKNSPAYSAVADTLPWAFDESLGQAFQNESLAFRPDGANYNEASMDTAVDHHLVPYSRKYAHHPEGSNDFGPHASTTHTSATQYYQTKHSDDAGSAVPGPIGGPQPDHALTSSAPSFQPGSAIHQPERAFIEAANPTPSRHPRWQELPHRPDDFPKVKVEDLDQGPTTSEPNKALSRHLDESHRRSASAQTRQKSIFRGGIERERREDQGSRHSSSHPVDLQGRASAHNWERDHRSIRAAGVSAPRSDVLHKDDNHGILDALESHLDSAQENVVYVDPSGRRLRKKADGTFVYHNSPSIEQHYRLPSPRDDPYPQDRHHEHRPIRYPSPRQEDSYPEERVYYKPRSSRHEEEYELVEVRDPQGDYFIKRPIQRDRRDRYTPAGRPSHREVGSGVPYPLVDNTPPTQGFRHSLHPRDPSMVPRQPPSGPELEDYDPRYPATGGTGREPPRYGR